ncbi:hypothetical protein GW916_02480 [bacterium]|nr:hypothetical protein [bacterium]
MFKLATFAVQTFVRSTSLALLFLMVTSSHTVFGKSEDSEGSSKVNCEKVAMEAVKNRETLGHKFKNAKEKTDHYEKAKKQCYSGGDSDTCKESLKSLKEAEAALVAACSKANMKSDGSAGNKACSAAIRKCEDRDSADIDASLDEDALPYNTDRIQNEIEQCPAIAGVDLKEMKTELKEAKEEVDDNEDDVSTAQEQVQESGSAMETINELTAQKDQAAIDCQKENASLEEQLNEQQKQLYMQTQELYTNVAQLNDQIVKTELARQKAGIDYSEALYQIDMECHQQALAKVNEARRAILAKVDRNEYRVGGLAKVISMAGMGTRKADQKEAMREYRNCQRSQISAIRRLKAKEISQLAERAADAEKARLMTEKSSLQRRIGELQTNETKDAQNQFLKRQALLNADCQNRQTAIQQQIATATMKGWSAQSTANQNLARAQAKLSQSKKEYDNIKKALRMKTNASNSSISGEDFAGAMNALASYEVKAESFNVTCCPNQDGLQGTCNEIASFVKSGGGDLISTELPDSTPEPDTDFAAAAQTDGEKEANGPVKPARTTASTNNKKNKSTPPEARKDPPSCSNPKCGPGGVRQEIEALKPTGRR